MADAMIEAVQHEDTLSVLMRLAALLLSDAEGHVSIAMRGSLVLMVI